MYLVTPSNSVDFLLKHNVGVEIAVGVDDAKDGCGKYIPFVKGIHLPYSGLNIAAFDKAERERSMNELKASMICALRYNVHEMVIHSCGFESINGENVGEYGIMIDSFKQLADFAASFRITLCLENMILRESWKRRLYCDSAQEWYQVHADIDKPNVLLTLDTSHAASCVVTRGGMADKVKALDEFLLHPELIARVHWSDSMITNNGAHYTDMHLVPGEGDLPREFHRRVKKLSALKLLEQRSTEARTAAGLAFIDAL